MSDPRDRSDDEIAEGVTSANVMRRESSPEDPPHEVGPAKARLLSLPVRHGMWSIRVRDAAGTLVAGTATTKDWQGDDNPDVGQLDIAVHPGHRRHGVGSLVAAHQLAVARALGRTRLMAVTSERLPLGPPVLESMGATVVQAGHRNELETAAVDVDLMHAWVADAAVRAADYELVCFDGATPDDLIDSNVELQLVLNTAPRDGLEVKDFTITAADVREGEAEYAAIGVEEWSILARHRPTGEWAGLHDVNWAPWALKLMQVGATGVKPAHRGHALGKWMKAAMTLRVMSERPDVTTIRTGNADSNDAMLGINRAMGYRPIVGGTTWELRCDQLERWLTSRGIGIPDLRAEVDAQRAGRVSRTGIRPGGSVSNAAGPCGAERHEQPPTGSAALVNGVGT